MYKLVKDIQTGNHLEQVLRLSDGMHIPFYPGNTDYEKYLKWLEEGNTPEPADEGQA